MKESLNIYDLLSKIDWEGGITGILDYGERNIEEYDVPDVLKDAWDEMEGFYSDFEGAMGTVQELLEETEIKYNADKEF